MPKDRPEVEVRRSARRVRTVSARREGDRIVVFVPARLSRAEEQVWVDRMVDRLTRPRRARGRTDTDLAARARQLSDTYLDGLAVPTSIRWVPPMSTRWGSCTSATGEIRISERLRGVPPWVLDYVLVHELAHLLEAGHGAGFWRLVERYPRTERARGFLDGLSAGAGLQMDEA